MPVIPQDAHYLLRCVCRTSDQIAVNNIHYIMFVENGSPTTEALLAAWGPQIRDAYAVLLSDEAFFYGLSLQRLVNGAAVAAPDVWVDETQGLEVSELLPKQSSGIISAYTLFPGPSGRGRIYVPFAGEGSNEPEGRPTLNYVDKLEALADEVYTRKTYSAPDLDNEVTPWPIIYNRANNTNKNIQRYIARRAWATQRRRGDYGKQNHVPF